MALKVLNEHFSDSHPLQPVVVRGFERVQGKADTSDPAPIQASSNGKVVRTYMRVTDTV